MGFKSVPFIQPYCSVLTKYYSGIVSVVNPSMNNHLHVSVVGVRSVYFFKEGSHFFRKAHFDNMGFIIPKYSSLIHFCKSNLVEGQEYVFQLQQDSKTGKMIVSDVYGVGV